MLWIAFVTVLTAVCGLVVLGALFTPRRQSRGVIIGGAVLAWVLLGVGSTLVASAHSIPAGHVGVVYTFGKITGQRDNGFQLTAPWQNLRTASIQVQRKQVDRIEAFSKETQDVFIVATINYSVSPDAIQSLYTDVGSQWYERLAPPRVVNFLKEETVKYNTIDIAPNREKVRTDVRDRLRRELAPYSITVQDFLIDNIDFSAQFKKAIEDKQAATQKAQEEQANVARETARANQAIEQAKGQAQSSIERARGEAESITLRGHALRDNPQVLQLEFIEALRSGNNQVIYLPSGNLQTLLPLPSLPPAQPRP